MVVDGGVGDPGPTQDFFTGDQAVQDDFGGGDDFGSPDTETGSAGDESGQQNGGATQSGPFAQFDPARPPNERDLILAMTDADADGVMMNYFDQNFLKNWAGPEHWKLRRAVKRSKLCVSLLDSAPYFL
jgi:condensin complex subunit 2